MERYTMAWSTSIMGGGTVKLSSKHMKKLLPHV
jgi:hypothetical protein